jgi:molybdopterin-containing oxidoreductase family membrane subunit
MLQFFFHGFRSVFHGSRAYWVWVTALLIMTLLGLNAYTKQLAHGLITTGMGDEVSWGLYIANFAFLVGMAAAAVMMVIPAYIFKDREMHKVVIFSELFAVAAMIMCLLFIIVDLGRPDRFRHLLPGIGHFNWPGSLLTWDVIVLHGYLLLNLYVCIYVLYTTFHGRRPKPILYVPVVFLAGSELFAEFYTDSAHTVRISHLFGLHGASLLAPWIWTSLAMNLIAAIILLSPARRNPTALISSCILIVIGIWIEKGLGFVVPGFIPSTLGDFVQYLPSANEMMLCIGIWAFGLYIPYF